MSINPINIYRLKGEEVLREELSSLDISYLKSMIRKYMPDARGYAYRWKDKSKVIEYIVARAKSLAGKGEVFVS